MIIPGTYSAALLLTIISMLCWGSWANTFKLSGKWRFELFYFDYSLGVLITAVIAAFTFGSLGDEMSFQDNLIIVGRTQMAQAMAAGVIFNLANMLLVAAISIAGLAVAFPIGIGLALVVGTVWNYSLNPQGNPAFLATGVVLIVGAIIVDAMAYAAHAGAQAKKVKQVKEAPALVSASSAPLAPAQSTSSSPRSSHTSHQSRRRKSSHSKHSFTISTGTKGIVLCLVSGLLMGSFYPLVEISKQGDNGLGPYSVAVMFAIGVFLSTFIFNLYFMNLPVEGQPVSFYEYFRGNFRQHILGVAGGVIWCAGTIANFVASSAPKTVQVGPAISYAIGQGATIVSALWGLLVWREFAGAEGRTRVFIGLMLVLFVAGLALLSLAPLFAH
jgi:glucose uptake protein